MTADSRNVTDRDTVRTASHPTEESTPFSLSWEEESGRDDPAQRYALYRLCECSECHGHGRTTSDHHVGIVRCPTCRGEGKVRELLATCETEAAVGVTICTLAREGEWQDCPLGLLDRQGEKGKKWLILPWLPSARNASDAGKLLRSRRK